ncbi:hypothetical protein MD484_g247, partial [Candolleomyces efflorescens]
MITLPKDEEARLDSQRARFSPSSPGSSRSVPFRDSDPTETDGLLSEVDSHAAAWLAGASTSANGAIIRGGQSSVGDVAGSSSHTNFDGPPPDFAPYEAEYFEVGNEDICSHDPHLNSDGEALYRFILARAQRPPFTRVHIKGSHTEHKTRWVTRTGNDGRSRQELENYTETVTDFSFYVDIKPATYTTRTTDGAVGGPIPIEPIHWSVADNVPAYRGKMVKEVEEVKIPGMGGIRMEKRKAKRKERKVRDKWAEEVSGRGLPPWCEEREIDLEGGRPSSLVLAGSMSPQLTSASSPWVESLAEIEQHPLRSSKTVRQWADEYCASPKHLKEFVYTQELYGWNMQQIESAIRSTVQATPYNGSLEISFTKHRSKIYIRPDNRLSRMLSNKWLKFLSIILLIFPFIWLFKRFHSRGGGRWEVCGGAYPLKRWVPIEDENTSGGGTSGDPTLPPYAPFDNNNTELNHSQSSSPAWRHQQLPSSSSSTLPRTPYSAAPSGLPTPMPSPSPFADPFSLPSTIARTRSSSSRVMQTPSGPKKLLGLREGEWFRRWEHAITRAVMMRYQSSEPLPEGAYGYAGPAIHLDGYMG